MAEHKIGTGDHVRGSKFTTYFATSGALSFALSAVGIALTAPFSVPGLIIIGGGIALAATEKGRGFLKKVGDQAADLCDDLMSHLSEDVGRLGNWWRRKTASASEKSAPAKGAPEAPSTFKGVSNTRDFNNAVTPAVEAAPEAKQPAPAPVVNPPKPSV